MSVALQGSLWRPGLPPGVYEEAPAVARRSRVRLDVAALVGLAERGPVNTPVGIDGPAQFARLFGRPRPGLNLPQAVRLFFANGGRRCVVVRCLDHAEVRTARLYLPGVTALEGGIRRQARIAARNPGAWGNGLGVRLRLVQVPAPLRAGQNESGAWRLYASDPRLGVGCTVRLLGLPVSPAGRPRIRLFRVSEARELPRGERELTPSPALSAAFRDPVLLRSAQELTLTLEVWLDGHLVERWDACALHSDHDRFLPRLIGRRAASEALRPPPSLNPDPDDPAGEADRLWGGPQDPWGSEYLRPSALMIRCWLRPTRALFSNPDGLYLAMSQLTPSKRGRDATATTGRRHFFDPTEMGPLQVAADKDNRLIPFGFRPGALDALATWDQAFPTEPVALVTLPDLLHGTAAEDQVDPDPGILTGTCLGTSCIAPQRGETHHAQDYPLLGLDAADLLSYQGRLVTHCEAQGTRIAMLDLPPGLTATEIVAWRRRLASDRAALYAPWLKAGDATRGQGSVLRLPPAAAACGITAQVELETGVWAAPANRRVLGVFDIDSDLPLPGSGFLFEERVDEVRRTERGLLLLGARTTSTEPDWTQIPVRRLLDWLKAQLVLDLAWAPFEPNDAALWSAMAGTARRRLRFLLDAGALAGRTDAESYFVRCDAGTHTPSDLDSGRAVLLVGVAPAVPAEFIVFRLVRHGAEDPRLEVI